MAIIEEVSFSRFYDAFNCRRDNFSGEGLKALYDYLEELSEGTGADLELDVIALCSEYAEYRNGTEYLDDYSTDLKKEEFEEIEEYWEAIEEEINDNTTLIKLGDDLNEGFIIKSY